MKNTKKTRRVAAFAAAVMMAACVAVPMSSFSASAAANNSITISGFNTTENNDDGTHTYEAYQVFSGQYADGVLGNIEWGSGVNGDAILSALHTASSTTGNALYGLFPDTVTDAKGIANVLSTITDHDDAKTQAFVAIVGKNLSAITSGSYSGGKISDLEDGYYMVQDKNDSPSTTPGEDNSGAKTRFILKVAGGGDVTVQAKSSAPSVVKKVKENTDVDDYEYKIGSTDADYNDVADYSIGDAVPFKLYGTLPSTLDDYTKYKYVFHDTLATEFTAPAKEGVKVYIDGTDKTASATVDVSGQTITVTFDDIITAGATKDSIVTVEYTAVLNANAQIGLPGQRNEVYLTYSNNPNWVGDGSGGPGDTPSDEGKTPKDEVIVFTYELDITKYLGDKNTTANDTGDTKAGFKLKAVDGDHADKWAQVDLTTGKITGWVDNKDDATEVTTAADGTFKFVGLDDGKYLLSETTTPKGYNTMADKALTIDATTVNGQSWNFGAENAASAALTAIKLTMDATDSNGSVNDGTVSGEIINQKGSSLPSTGGIGTTLFYVGGGVLVAGAGVLLITKKRAKKDAE